VLVKIYSQLCCIGNIQHAEINVCIIDLERALNVDLNEQKRISEVENHFSVLLQIEWQIFERKHFK